MAPKAVVHETVYPKVHHVREEIYTREIHDEHIYDRILPIIDVQVLPAKHFAPMGPNGEFVEVPAAAVAARGGGPHGGKNWVIAETISKIPAGESDVSGPRRFTARTFQSTEGDERHWVDRDGIERSEQTWVHPPTVAIGARMRGLTEAVHFGLEDQYLTRQTQLPGFSSHDTHSEFGPRTGEASSRHPHSEDSRAHSTREEDNSILQESSGYYPDAASQFENSSKRQGHFEHYSGRPANYSNQPSHLENRATRQESSEDNAAYQRSFSQYHDSSVEPDQGLNSGRNDHSSRPRQDVGPRNDRGLTSRENDTSLHLGYGRHSSNNSRVVSGPYQQTYDYSSHPQAGMNRDNSIGGTAAMRNIPGAFGGDSTNSQQYLEGSNPTSHARNGDIPGQALRDPRTSNNNFRDSSSDRYDMYRTPMGGADGSYDSHHGGGSTVEGEGDYDADEHDGVGMAR